MDFLSGFAGLFLFIGNWFSPSTDGELQLRSFELSSNSTHLVYQLDFRWSDEATAIIDAGIPLIIEHRYEFTNDTPHKFTRILRSSVEKSGYTVLDSSQNGTIKKENYSNIYLAIKGFQKVDIFENGSYRSVEILLTSQPSPVSSLSRTIDLSSLVGGDHFSAKYELE
jgi:hypothetical protein